MKILSAKEVFAILRGKWCFTRLISTGDEFYGTANFTKSQEESYCLLYTEKGNNFYQSYFYKLSQDQIAIYDRNNKKMLDLKTINFDTLSGKYLCNLDQYQAFLKIIDEDSVILTYKVNGPVKNYAITTNFIREPQ